MVPERACGLAFWATSLPPLTLELRPVSSSPVPVPVLRTVQVLGGASGGAHVRSLATGLAARGVRVTVCAPVETEGEYDFTSAGARFTPDAVSALRAAVVEADVVHAHGVRAGMRAALALRGRRVPLVVSWHGGGPGAGRLSLLLERHVARAAAVVLGASSAQVDLARLRGRGTRGWRRWRCPRGRRGRWRWRIPGRRGRNWVRSNGRC